MTALARRLAPAMVAIAGLFVTGCRPALESLQAAPRLTFDELRTGKVALMPLAAKIKEVPLRDLERLDVIYAHAFDTHAHGLRRVPSKVVIAALDNYTNWDTVVRFGDTGKADIRALEWLSGAVGARYLVFSRVEYAEIYDTSADFVQWIANKAAWERLRSGHATEAVDTPGPTRTCGHSTPPQRHLAQFSGNVCATSELNGFVFVVDAMTGTAPWHAKHRISRGVGNSRVESNPVPLGWALFSDIFSRLPEPG